MAEMPIISFPCFGSTREFVLSNKPFEEVKQATNDKDFVLSVCHGLIRSPKTNDKTKFVLLDDCSFNNPIEALPLDGVALIPVCFEGCWNLGVVDLSQKTGWVYGKSRDFFFLDE
mmetsp:Transcript_21953/g.34119  ORF Transcript_21953/g.34119 Transcript_21953/m.34119 type:complete len:115 (+) Transcript_21953:140-484(+)